MLPAPVNWCFIIVRTADVFVSGRMESGSVGALNGLIGFSQSSMKTNEYTIKPELLHLKWIHSRIPVKEGYIVLKLNAEGESTIDIPAGCTVRIIKKIGKKPLVLREQGGYSFRLKD